MARHIRDQYQYDADVMSYSQQLNERGFTLPLFNQMTSGLVAAAADDLVSLK